MRNLYTFLAAVIITATTLAQTPEKMSYQAVVRDSGDNLVTSQTVGMQISILQTSATGTAVYVETQTPTTNVNGLVSLEIGTGSVVSGDFTTIDWSADTYFIKTETDPMGGSSYSITGNSQLLSVPYALYAKTSGSSIPGPAGPIGPTGPAGPAAIGGDQCVAQARSTTSFINDTGSWATVSFDTTDIETLASCIDHDDTFRERLILKEDGPYIIYYHGTVNLNTSDIVSARVVVNGVTEISGSYQRVSTKTNNSYGDLDNVFVFEAFAGDFVELQVRDDAGSFDSEAGFIFGSIRLKGSKGMDWKGTWTTSISYSETEVVTNGSNVYYCKASHTADGSNEPGVGANWNSYWDILVDSTLHNHDHNSLTNIVVNEHIDHSTVNINAGVGLSGGGTIVASRIIDLDISSIAVDGAPNIEADYVLSYDSSSASHKRVLIEKLKSEINIAVFKDEKPIGTNGGTLISGSWQIRTLNTTSTNGLFATLTNNEITIQPGKYLITAIVPAYRVDNHQARLYNITDSIVESYSMVSTSTSSMNTVVINALLDISSSKTYEIQHIGSTTRNSDGFGLAAGWGNEVYTSVTITKLD